MHEEILIRLLKDQGITLAASLPCDKAKDLFSLLPESFETIELLREEDGVGVCAGAYLAGRKPAMFIQSRVWETCSTHSSRFHGPMNCPSR